MILTKAYIRNSIGLYDGLGVFEVNLDLSQFSPGIIGIIGKNGTGKTTLMENFIPYRSMVSRSGSLYEEYFNSFKCDKCGHDNKDYSLKVCPRCQTRSVSILDGMRVLEWTMNGHSYKSVFNIDVVNKRSTAYLFRDGEALNDKIDEYNILIEELLGPFPIFRKSVFAGQQEESLSDLTKSQLKKFFSQLVDIEKYETIYRPKNKLVFDGIERDIGQEKVRLEELGKNISDKKQIEHELKLAEEKLEQIAVTINNHTNQFNELEQKQKDIQERITLSKNAQNRIQQIAKDGELAKKKLDQYERNSKLDIQRHENRIEELTERTTRIISEDKPNLEKEIEAQTKLLINEKQISLQHTELLEIESNLQKAYDDREKKSTYNEWSQKRKALKEKLNTQKLSSQVPCNKPLYSKCPLFENAKQTDDIQSELDELLANEPGKPQESTLDVDKLLKHKELLENENIKQRFSALGVARERLESLRSSFESTNSTLNRYEQEITENQTALKSKREGRTKELDWLNTEVLKLRAEYIEQESLIDKSLLGESENIGVAITDLKNKLSLLQGERGGTVNHISVYKSNLERIVLWEEEYSAINNNIRSKLVEVEERKIVDMFLKDLPVWELENLSPTIMGHVNNLLAEFYDSAWTLRIDTLSPMSRGDGYKEDFKITVFKEGDPRDFDKLSVGQRNMIESTLRQAIKLVGQDLNSRTHETAFCDESDGAFDSENADIYYNMLEHVHSQGKMYFTFIITHRQELIDRMDQYIELDNGSIITSKDLI
jgi:DNA repair exonuclease SbcCD ATPase subunit